MKLSLIALIACCAASGTAFALTDDMPGSHPPQLRLTDDMPGSHPPQLRLIDDMPGSHPPQVVAQRRLAR